MEPTLKKIIAVLAAIFLAFVTYYGSYLPLQKSTAFVDAMQRASSASNVKDFEQVISGPLDMPSPIGQEELVRNAASSILGTMQNAPDPRLVQELNHYISGYFDPILARGRGMSFGQDLYIFGAINEISFIKTQDTSYLDLAERYYQESVDMAPERPQGLYGLFDVYRMRGDVEKTKEIGARILTLWPTDSRTASALGDYLATHAAPPPAPVAK